MEIKINDNEVTVNGVTYVKKEEIVEETTNNENKLYRVVEFSGIDWYVVEEDDETMTLLMKDIFSKNKMEKYFNRRDLDSVRDVRFNRYYNNAWRDSFLRMVLNSAFLKDLDINEMEVMEVTDNNITTKDYVRLLTKEEANSLPGEIRQSSKWGYWLMSACPDSPTHTFAVDHNGYVDSNYNSIAHYGVRVVVKIKKWK